MTSEHYIIRGGEAGRERLRLLDRIMRPASLAFLERVGIESGQACLDVGCGGGDVTLELARRVGFRGRAIGIDVDEIKLELARGEAEAAGVTNVTFRAGDIRRERFEPEFDRVYARFLLSHLPDPELALSTMASSLGRGGVMLLEDVDFAGHFCHPDVPAFRRYVALYSAAAERRGGDPQIGPKLPAMLRAAGLTRIDMRIVQPAATRGDVKLINPVTMENIADAVVAEGLATRDEVACIVDGLYAAARDTETLMSAPRIVQAWGYKARPG